MDDQDRVDEPALRRQIQRLIAAGIHGIFVRGSAGEEPLLADALWLSGIKYAVSRLGIGSGRTVSPFQPLISQQPTAIDAFLVDIENWTESVLGAIV